MLSIQQFVFIYDGNVDYNNQAWEKPQQVLSQLFSMQNTAIVAVQTKPAPLQLYSPVPDFLAFSHSPGATPHSLLFSEFLRCIRAIAFAQFSVVIRDHAKKKQFFFTLTPDGLRFTKTADCCAPELFYQPVPPDARVVPIPAIIAVTQQDPTDPHLRFRYSHMVHLANGRVRAPSTLSPIALKDWIQKIETVCILCTRQSYVCLQDINDAVFTDNPFTPHVTRHVGCSHVAKSAQT
jgi:hypothetical protein